MSDQTAIQKVGNYLTSEVVRSRFAEVIGNGNAGAYISSVLLAVTDSADLQKCTPQSIYTSALRAATLRLSVDPGLGQAYLVPFKKKDIQIAILIVGYKGLHDMAVRTNQYKYINVAPIYEGETVIEDRLSGLHEIYSGNPDALENRVNGYKTKYSHSDVIIGWIGSFQMWNGYKKTMYMTVKEIHDHAKKYSKSYNNESGVWKKDPQKMERKTTLRLLLRRWGYLDPTDSAVLEEIETQNNDDEIVEGELLNREPEEEPTQSRSEEEILADLGYSTEPKVQEETTPTSDLFKKLVELNICVNETEATQVIAKLHLLNKPIEEALKMARGYRGWRDIGADSKQAAQSILKGQYPK